MARCERCRSVSRCEHRVGDKPDDSSDRQPADKPTGNPTNKPTSNLNGNQSNLIKSSTLNSQKPIKSSGQPASPGEKKLLDLDQPFLLYKSYSSRQVIAHCLDVSSAAQQESLEHFQRTGPSLLIPESYSGI